MNFLFGAVVGSGAMLGLLIWLFLIGHKRRVRRAPASNEPTPGQKLENARRYLHHIATTSSVAQAQKVARKALRETS
ncbi:MULTISPECIES: hypothetical protein [unclassified Sulfitobacter]|uniref:hypothetical protein n=1 Tax=unclassified Sulfitobacter TaxID=196795 RepID=UPI001AD9787F|nr:MULTISPECIES: hypothetical protein [unclassified Sulfitobacter]MBO9430575.1 hypothetical protein [Sulfitobacter sp. R18_1]WPZ30716.1 hypothetical protein T8A63_06560 [Sulfitobacter sp. OXR-159]WPZ30817.1 hypothetical protein T8A63_07070 [Sulfitobacter sp. OXR-159]